MSANRFVIVAMTFACAWAVPAFGIEFAAVDIGPSSVPDRLIQFDSSNPAGTQTTTATFAAEMIRGMDLIGPTTGWYVSTDGPGAGFYRMTNGVSTFLGPVPFPSSDTGGLTLSRDNSFLYYAIREFTSPLRVFLSRVELDGTVTSHGVVTGFAQSEARIAGLATHPQTGVLYALCGSEDALYTIDPATRIATRLGTGLSINTSDLGGLDFTPDGRLFAVGFGLGGSGSSLFEIDPNTGSASLIYGSLGFVSSSVAFVPEPGACAAVLGLSLLLTVGARRWR